MQLISWDARTRPQGRRTRVQRDRTRGRDRDAADRASLPRWTASCHVARPESGRRGPTRLKSAPIRRKSAPTRPKSGRLGPYRPYRPVSACIGRNGQVRPKKKKTVQTHRFTNLKKPRPSLLRPASQSAPHLSVSLSAPMKN